MFCCKKSYRLLANWINVSKSTSILGHHRRHYVNSKIKFFTKILEFNTANAAKLFLEKNDFIAKTDPHDISDSVDYLTNIGITVDEIKRLPRILCLKHTILRNRYEILNECGCSTVNVYVLSEYRSISNSTVASLKRSGIIDLNLQQRLANHLNVEFRPCHDSVSLTDIRMHFLRSFFTQNDFMSDKDFDDEIGQLQYVRNKSYRWTTEIVKLLTDQFRIPKTEIKGSIHMVQTDPDNLHKLLEIKSIGGEDITDILLRSPILLSTSYEAVRRTLTQLKKFGISDEAIIKIPQVLAMDSETVRDRLSVLKRRKELQALNFHPNILRLIVHKFKAQPRLDQLIDLDKKCFNISVLTGSFKKFQKFTGTENDKHISSHCVLFLARTLKVEKEFVQRVMSRHPYWLYIPFIDMKQTIDVLKRFGFALKDIAANIHIVLYSSDLIVSRLKKFNEDIVIGDHRWTNLSKRIQLKLVLYQIEAEFHFSGDGVWLDRKSNLNFD